MGQGCGAVLFARHWTDTIMVMPSGKQPEPGPFARAFSAHVRMVMGRERITTTALGLATGLSRNYLGKRLRDEAPFTLNEVELICKALNQDLVEFIRAAAGDEVEDDQER